MKTVYVQHIGCHHSHCNVHLSIQSFCHHHEYDGWYWMQVLEAAVIAIPHPKWTERPLLVVVSAPGSNLTKEDVLSFLQV